MLAYTVIGSNNKEKALEFYDAVLAEAGAQRAFANDRLQFYSNGTGAMLGVGDPWDKGAATVGNGVMVAIAVDSPEKVDALHAKALELGGTDEGPPGPRQLDNFYAGYFRDLDGNKLNAFYYGQ